MNINQINSDFIRTIVKGISNTAINQVLDLIQQLVNKQYPLPDEIISSSELEISLLWFGLKFSMNRSPWLTIPCSLIIKCNNDGKFSIFSVDSSKINDPSSLAYKTQFLDITSSLQIESLIAMIEKFIINNKNSD